MDKKRAYAIVLFDLMECGLCVGKCDWSERSTGFMHGIETVMEQIAYSVSEEVGDAFDDTFVRNLLESQDKAREKNKRKLEE